MEHVVRSRAFVLGFLNITLLSFRECQSDEREEQRALERNPGNGPEGHLCDPARLCGLHPSLPNTHQPLISTLPKKGGVTMQWSFKSATYELPNPQGAPKDWVCYPPLQPSPSVNLIPMGIRCTDPLAAARSPTWFRMRKGELPFTLSQLPQFN